MLYSALIILLRVLKLNRIQDIIGNKPQERNLLAVACVAAANQCEKNINGRPLFMKNLMRALFIGQNFAEASFAYGDKAEDYVGLMTFEDWR